MSTEEAVRTSYSQIIVALRFLGIGCKCVHRRLLGSQDHTRPLQEGSFPVGPCTGFSILNDHGRHAYTAFGLVFLLVYVK